MSRKIAQRNLGRRAVLGGLLSLVAVVTILSAAAGSTGELEESQGWYIKAREAFHQGFGLTGNAKGDKEEMRELDLLKVSSQSLSLLICAGGPLSWERSRLQVINFETPQETLASQLKDGVRYATAMSYGGHGTLSVSLSLDDFADE